jgi:hypothetical protein
VETATRLGARALVASNWPSTFQADGWQHLGDSPYYVLLLDN